MLKKVVFTEQSTAAPTTLTPETTEQQGTNKRDEESLSYEMFAINPWGITESDIAPGTACFTYFCTSYPHLNDPHSNIDNTLKKNCLTKFVIVGEAYYFLKNTKIVNPGWPSFMQFDVIWLRIQEFCLVWVPLFTIFVFKVGNQKWTKFIIK